MYCTLLVTCDMLQLLASRIKTYQEDAMVHSRRGKSQKV